MIPIPFNNLYEISRVNSLSQIAHSGLGKIIAKRGLEVKPGMEQEANSLSYYFSPNIPTFI